MEIKMSDIFNLPVKRVNSAIMCANGRFLRGARHAEYSATAINSHDKLTEENKMLLLDFATLKKAMCSAVVVIENESDMDKASSLLTRALADTEDFK